MEESPVLFYEMIGVVWSLCDEVFQTLTDASIN